MLHSEDADINKVLRQVIELDKRAERIKSDVMERAEEILEQTKKRIIDKEKMELGQVQEEEKNKYQNEIAKARDESILIIDSMKQDIGKLQCRYNEMKDQKATEFLDDLFKT